MSERAAAQADRKPAHARRRMIVGLSAGAIGMAAFVAIAGMVGAGSTHAQPAANSPDFATARVMSFDIATTASGELEALRQIELRSQIDQDTAITEVVPEGSLVKAGDVLIRLNADSIQTNIDEEQLRVETARAEYATAENNYLIQVSDNESATAKALLNVQVAELELKQWFEGEVKSARQANDLAYERAVRELDRLKEKYERSVELEKRGFLSRDELKRDEVAYLEAQAALKTAELSRKVYDEYQFPKDEKVKQSAVDQAKAELDRTKRQNESQLGTKEADRSNKRQQLNLREQKLAKYKEQFAAATIRAPSDGLVVYATSVNRDRWGNNNDGALDVGRIVKRNAPLILLPDTSEMVASVRVHESLSGRIRKGQNASVRIDALAGRLVPGQVLSIGVIAESGGMRDPNLREYTVKIKLDMSAIEIPLKPSMRCEAEILLDRVNNALAVPIQGVLADGLVRYVLVPEGSQFRKLPVRVGRRSDRLAEITVGLKDGDRVLVRQAQPVEVVNKPWNKDELNAVGLTLSAEGRVEMMGGPPSRGAMPGGAPSTDAPADRPRGNRRERPAADPNAAKPAGAPSPPASPTATTPTPPAPASPSSAPTRR